MVTAFEAMRGTVRQRSSYVYIHAVGLIINDEMRTLRVRCEKAETGFSGESRSKLWNCSTLSAPELWSPPTVEDSLRGFVAMGSGAANTDCLVQRVGVEAEQSQLMETSSPPNRLKQ
ncbi:hypothetical protein DSM21852_13440 [Methylocystis bryophila]|nr:hypothetical protein DSM21852_13440 [Methylocystis bryophila]